MSGGSAVVTGRLVLADTVAAGRIVVEDGRIASVDVDGEAAGAAVPYLAPGFVDVHVHGGGGHDAMGSTADSRRDGATSPAAWRHRVPADGGDRAGPDPQCVRRTGPGLAARWPRGWRPTSGVQPRRAVPRRRAQGRPRSGLPPRARGHRYGRPRTAPRRPAGDDDRAGAARRASTSSPGSASEGWCPRWVTRRRRWTRRVPGSRPAARRRPTCSTR